MRLNDDDSAGDAFGARCGGGGGGGGGGGAPGGIWQRGSDAACHAVMALVLADVGRSVESYVFGVIAEVAARAGVLKRPAWVALPVALTHMILDLLSPRDLVLGAERVCRLWRRQSYEAGAGDAPFPARTPRRGRSAA
jgi:hypothetical protein